MTEFDGPSPTTTQRATAIKKPIAEINKLRAKRQVTDALNTRNGPNFEAIHNLELNSPVLVWCEGNTGQNRSWQGPYRLIGITREDCVLALPRGNTTFCTTSVKPYLTDVTTAKPCLTDDRNGNADTQPQEQTDKPKIDRDTVVVQPPEPGNGREPALVKRGRGRPRKYPLPTSSPDITVFLQNDDQFWTLRHKEVIGLIEKGVFEIATDIPQDVRTFKA
jgi:hypothetical protein